MQVALVDDALRVGEHFQLVFQRTLRIPDDGRTYPLPPGLGRFPLYRCAAYAQRMPDDWAAERTFFIPMYQREALWLGFGNDWPPIALKVALGGINAISGRSCTPGLHSDPQDYLVCPEQLWLDGINTGPATIRQFVDMAFFLAITPWPYADLYKDVKDHIATRDYRKYNLVEPVIKPVVMTWMRCAPNCSAASGSSITTR